MSEIDRTTIKIEADAGQVAGEVGKAKDAVEGGFAASLKSAKNAAFGLIGTIGSIVATATGFYKLGAVIREEIEFRLKSGTDRAKEFVESLDMSNGQQSVAALSKELETLNSRIAGSQEDPSKNFINTLLGQSVDSMKEQAAELEKTRASVQAAVNAKEQRAREKKAADEKAERDKKIAAEAQAADDAVRASLGKTLEGEDKILAERNANIMRLKDAREKAETDYAKSAYDTAISFEKKAADAAVAEYRKGLEEKKAEAEKAAREDEARFEKLAQAQADAITRAFTRINREAQAATNLDRFQALGDNIIDLLQAIERRRGD